MRRVSDSQDAVSKKGKEERRAICRRLSVCCRCLFFEFVCDLRWPMPIKQLVERLGTAFRVVAVSRSTKLPDALRNNTRYGLPGNHQTSTNGMTSKRMTRWRSWNNGEYKQTTALQRIYFAFVQCGRQGGN